jgi:CHAT domain-containing protein
MLKSFFKIILILIVFGASGCAVAFSPLTTRTEDLYQSRKFDELNQYLTSNEGTLSIKVRQRILNENINKIKLNQMTTFEFLKYQFDIKYYIYSLTEVGEFDKALKFCNEALQETSMISDLLIKRKYQYESIIENNYLLAIDLYHFKGYIVWFITGDKGKTLEIFKEAKAYISRINNPSMAIFDSIKRKKVDYLSGDAIFYDKIMGEYRKSLEINEEELKLTDSMNLFDTDIKYAYKLQSYQRIMNLYMKLGELENAKKTLEQYNESTGNMIYKGGHLIVRQIPHFRDALATLEAETGSLFALLQDKNKSEEYFNKAFDIVNKIDPHTQDGLEKETIGRYYVLYGTYHIGFLQNDYQEAIKSVDYGLSYLSTYYYSGITDAFDIATAYIYSGELHYLTGDYVNAIKQADKSIEYSQKYQNKITEARAHTLKGKSLYAIHNKREAKKAYEKGDELIKKVKKEGIESTENWELYYGLGKVYEDTDDNLALVNFKKAVMEVENLWQGRFKDTEKQVRFIDNRLVVFEPVIRILSKQKKYDDAINYIERSKSRTVYETSPYYNVEEDINKKDGDTFKPLSSRSLKELASGKTAFLEYYIGEHSVIAAVITKKGIYVEELQKTTPKDLQMDVIAFRKAIENGKYPYKERGSKLYSILIEPIAKYLSGYESICIIPHGVLHNLPFNALISDESKPLFLIDKYKISYAPSLTVLNLAYKPNHTKKTTLLAIGNSLEVNIKDLNVEEDKLGRLRFVNDEVQEVGSLFNDSDKTVFIDDKATETVVKNESHRFDIILFSAHGILLANEPLKSCIFLQGDNENKDGRLTVSDIEKMHLNSNLVILSACETGLVTGYEGGDGKNEYKAKFPHGDDLVGLQRAFIKAGSSSVLSTLWVVNDEATKSLIVDFVKRYKEGKDKVTALQEATLMLKQHKEKQSNEEWEHPHYWAPFILSGDWR